MAKDIKFKTFWGRNFLSIGNTPVKIDLSTPGLTRISGTNVDDPGRKNAIGKSTIMDGISVALFGDPIRKGIKKKDGLVNFKTKKNCEISVSFDSVDSDGTVKNYVVNRGYKPSFLTVIEDGVEKTHDTIANTDAFIREVFSGGHAVFTNCQMLSVNAADPFMTKDAKERREFIEGIFGLEVFRMLTKTVGEDLKTQRSKIEVVSSAVTTLNSSKSMTEKSLLDAETYNSSSLAAKNRADAELKDAIAKIEAYNSGIEAERKAIIEDYAKKKADAKAHNDGMTAKIEAIEAELDSEVTKKTKENAENLAIFEAEKSRLSQILDEKKVISDEIRKKTLEKEATIKEKRLEIKILREDLSEITPKRFNAQQKVHENEREQSLLTDELAKYDNTEVCPKCKQPISKHSQAEIEAEKRVLSNKLTNWINNAPKVKEEADALVKKEADIKDEINKMTKIVDSEGDTLHDEWKKADSDEKVAQRNLNNHSSSLVQHDISAIELAYARKIMSIKKIDLAPLLLNEQRELDSLVLKTTVDVEKKHKDTIASISFKDTESLKNIIAELDTQIAEKKEELVNLKRFFDVLSLVKFVVSDDGARAFFIKKTLVSLNERIRYFLNKKLGSKLVCHLDESLEETIFDGNGNETSYGNLSGAEKKSVDLACMFAFNAIKAAYGNTKYDTMFFDEIFDTSFCPKGVEIVMSLIKEEVEKNALKCFVITHNPLLVNHFDREITLKMENGFTELAE